jgi:hypothetical protein
VNADRAPQLKRSVGWLLVVMIGKQITVEYDDQNESFSHLLPRADLIVREVSLVDWNAGWYLLHLHEPFDYQHKIAEPYVFRETHIGHLLIKSRWEGVEIGEARTSVFVLLVPDASVLETGRVSSKDFIHACWGVVN